MTHSTPSYSNPYEFDLLMLEPVHQMMDHGIKIDQKKKKQLQDKAIFEWNEGQTKLDEIAGLGVALNVGSTKQVPQFLFDILKLPAKKRKGKYISDNAALRATMAECIYKIKTLKQDNTKIRWMRGAIACRHILNIRARRKLISSYLGLGIEKGKLAGARPFEDDDGFIRGTISVGGTETARFSHSKTLWGTGINLATVPRKLRGMFIPEDGYEFIEFDLERGESWIYAHLSEDPELLRIHLEGLDFHSETAAVISNVFGSPLDLQWIIDNKDEAAYKIRFLGKKINHASAYRMSPFMGAVQVNGESDDTGITIVTSQFKAALDRWKQKYFMMESWWSSIEAQLVSNKTLKTPYGRVHQFHDRVSTDTLKAATAYVPQSTSVDYLNRGWLRVHHKFQCRGAWDMAVLAQTHDSILIQLKIGNREEAIGEIVQALKSKLVIKGREFSIPIDGSVGPNWKDLRAS